MLITRESVGLEERSKGTLWWRWGLELMARDGGGTEDGGWEEEVDEEKE